MEQWLPSASIIFAEIFCDFFIPKSKTYWKRTVIKTRENMKKNHLSFFIIKSWAIWKKHNVIVFYTPNIWQNHQLCLVPTTAPHQPSHPHVTEVSLFRCTHHQWWTITLYDETNIWIKDNAIYAYCATKYEEQKWYTKFGLPSILVYIHIHLYIKNHGKFW